jgi:hypothetical protein
MRIISGDVQRELVRSRKPSGSLIAFGCQFLQLIHDGRHPKSRLGCRQPLEEIDAETDEPRDQIVAARPSARLQLAQDEFIDIRINIFTSVSIPVAIRNRRYCIAEQFGHVLYRPSQATKPPKKGTIHPIARGQNSRVEPLDCTVE